MTAVALLATADKAEPEYTVLIGRFLLMLTAWAMALSTAVHIRNCPAERHTASRIEPEPVRHAMRLCNKQHAGK